MPLIGIAELFSLIVYSGTTMLGIIEAVDRETVTFIDIGGLNVRNEDLIALIKPNDTSPITLLIRFGFTHEQLAPRIKRLSVFGIQQMGGRIVNLAVPEAKIKRKRVRLIDKSGTIFYLKDLRARSDAAAGQ